MKRAPINSPPRWDADGIFSKRSKQSMAYAMHASLLRQLRENVELKRFRKLSKGVFFHQNKSVESAIAMAASNDFCFSEAFDFDPFELHIFPN
jgi:hypothetical protein